MASKLNAASEKKLAGVNFKLAQFVRQLAAYSPYPFVVTEGVRTKARQRELLAAKKTKTLNSRHLIGRAVDIAPVVNGAISWEWKHFEPIIRDAKQLAADLGLELVFGYDWGWDAPHIEMKEP